MDSNQDVSSLYMLLSLFCLFCHYEECSFFFLSFVIMLFYIKQ